MVEMVVKMVEMHINARVKTVFFSLDRYHVLIVSQQRLLVEHFCSQSSANVTFSQDKDYALFFGDSFSKLSRIT